MIPDLFFRDWTIISYQSEIFLAVFGQAWLHIKNSNYQASTRMCSTAKFQDQEAADGSAWRKALKEKESWL